MRAVESPGEELQLRKLNVLIDPLENAIDVCPRLDEISRKTKRLRRRLRVLEPAGIGDERDVQRLGDLRREREVELVEHVGEDLPGRGRIRDDEVDVPEARVVVVMVDVDDERRRVDRARLGSHPTGARAVDRDEHALAEVGRALSPEPALLQLEEPVLAGEGRGSTEEHHDVLAELGEGEAHREQGAERVAVGSLVRGDHEAIVLSEGGRNRLHVSLGRHLPPGERARR